MVQYYLEWGKIKEAQNGVLAEEVLGPPAQPIILTPLLGILTTACERQDQQQAIVTSNRLRCNDKA